MIAALELANSALEAAQEGIDNPGTMPEAEIHELLDTANRLTARSREQIHLLDIEGRGQEALEELTHLEKVRRLIAYGLSQGKGGREEVAFLETMKSRPPIDKAKGIRGCTPAFEWLGANRRTIAVQLGAILNQPETRPEIQ